MGHICYMWLVFLEEKKKTSMIIATCPITMKKKIPSAYHFDKYPITLYHFGKLTFFIQPAAGRNIKREE